MKKSTLLKRTLLIAPIFILCLFTNNAVADNSVPTVDMLDPSSGSTPPDKEIIFTTAYQDPDGSNDINACHLRLIDTVSSGITVYTYYSQSSNRLHLYDSLKGTWPGGYTPGSDNKIDTAFAILNCKNTEVSGQGNTLTIKWAVTFKEKAQGNKDTYLWVNDMSKATLGWVKKGTWRVRAVVPLPRIIRFQGRLSDDTQTPVNGTVKLTFRLYYKESGGTSVWEETQEDIPIEDGILDVELGSVTSLNDVVFDIQYWLGIEVESDGEMTPRFKLTSVPYAFRSEE